MVGGQAIKREGGNEFFMRTLQLSGYFVAFKIAIPSKEAEIKLTTLYGNSECHKYETKIIFDNFSFSLSLFYLIHDSAVNVYQYFFSLSLLLISFPNFMLVAQRHKNQGERSD